MWPKVCILICTFRRPEEIRATIDALMRNLSYPNLEWLITDDSTGDDYLASLEKDYPFVKTLTTQHRSGWGINVNGGLYHARHELGCEYIYFTEDDYILMKKLDLRVGVALLENLPHVGLVRYDGIAGHHIVGTMQEARVSAHLPNYREGMGPLEVVNYWQLDKASHNLNIYSNRPHLKHSRFHDYYGTYIPGRPLGLTESDFAHRYRDAMHSDGAPQIVVPADWAIRYYDDIGKSFQHTEHDIGGFVA